VSLCPTAATDSTSVTSFWLAIFAGCRIGGCSATKSLWSAASEHKWGTARLMGWTAPRPALHDSGAADEEDTYNHP
jgi:hypothetical protein